MDAAEATADAVEKLAFKENVPKDEWKTNCKEAYNQGMAVENLPKKLKDTIEKTKDAPKLSGKDIRDMKDRIEMV